MNANFIYTIYAAEYQQKASICMTQQYRILSTTLSILMRMMMMKQWYHKVLASTQDIILPIILSQYQRE